MSVVVEVLATYLGIGLAALFGSAIMWLTLGPFIARRGMAQFSKDAWDLSDEEAASPKAMMKAITKKQGEVFGNAVYGSLGKIVADAPTEELTQLADQFGGIKEVANTLTSSTGGDSAASQFAPLMEAVQGGGKGNSFSKVVQMIMAMQAMSQMGSGGQGGTPVMGMGNGGSGLTYQE